MRLGKFTKFVKEQMEFHQRQATRYEHDERRANRHTVTAGKFSELLEFLEQQASENVKQDQGEKRLQLSFADLAGLPDELLKELSVTDADKLEFAIEKLIKENGGVATLDRILVGLFNETGEVIKRQNLNSRIYRMGQKNMVHSVPTKKGVYSIEPMSEEEALKLV